MQPTLLDDEYIVYKTKQHWIVFAPYVVVAIFAIWFFWSLLFSGFGIALGVVGIIVITPVLAEYSSTKAIITNKRVISKTGLTNEIIETIQIDEIEHVYILKDALGMGFIDFGSVRVASGTPSVTLAHMRNLTELARHINEQIEESRKSNAKNDTSNRG